MTEDGCWIKMWPGCTVYPGIQIRQFIGTREIRYIVKGPALLDNFFTIEEIPNNYEQNRPSNMRFLNVSYNLFLDNKFEIFIEGLDPDTVFPKTLSIAIAVLDEVVDDEEKIKIKKKHKDDFLAENHFNLGLYIRNNFGLHLGNIELINDLNAEGMDPSEISSIIMSKYYDHLPTPHASDLLIELKKLHPDIFICLETRLILDARQESAGVLIDIENSTALIYILSDIRWFDGTPVKSVNISLDHSFDKKTPQVIINHREELYQIFYQSAFEINFHDFHQMYYVIKFPWRKSDFDLINSMERLIIYSLTDEYKKEKDYYYGFGNFGSKSEIKEYLDTLNEHSYY